MTTDIRYYHSGMADAPVLSGTPGALIALIDACREGFCTRPLDSLTVTDGIATAILSAGNPYEFPAVISLSGAPVPELNADWRIATSSADRFTFACPGIPNGTVTGTLIAKRAGMSGWTKPFSDTHRAVYQSADLSSSQLYLYVDDTEATYASVRGYEQVDGIDARSGPFPTSVTSRWSKSNLTTAARSWCVISSPSMLWIPIAWSANSPNNATFHLLNHFGDGRPFDSSDRYFCLLSAHSTTNPSAPLSGHPHNKMAPSGSSEFRATARSASAAAGPVQTNLAGLTIGNASALGQAGQATDTGGGVIIGPVAMVCDGQTSQLRGELSGFHPVLQSPAWDPISIVEADDRAFLCVNIGGPFAAFDIIGPWS